MLLQLLLLPRSLPLPVPPPRLGLGRASLPRDSWALLTHSLPLLVIPAHPRPCEADKALQRVARSACACGAGVLAQSSRVGGGSVRVVGARVGPRVEQAGQEVGDFVARHAGAGELHERGELRVELGGGDDAVDVRERSRQPVVHAAVARPNPHPARRERDLGRISDQPA